MKLNITGLAQETPDKHFRLCYPENPVTRAKWLIKMTRFPNSYLSKTQIRWENMQFVYMPFNNNTGYRKRRKLLELHQSKGLV